MVENKVLRSSSTIGEALWYHQILYNSLVRGSYIEYGLFVKFEVDKNEQSLVQSTVGWPRQNGMANEAGMTEVLEFLTKGP